MIKRTDYPSPVSKLLDHGPLEGSVADVDSWFDYVGHYEFDEIDVVSLLDLMGEGIKAGAKRPNDRTAPIHACRALAQLGDMVAMRYFDLLVEQSNNKPLVENVKAAFPLLARSNLANLETYFNDPEMENLHRIGMVDQAIELTERYEQCRDFCVAFFIRALSNYDSRSADSNGLDLNGLLIHHLVDFEATEASELIHEALRSGKVNDELTGSWATVQVDLKLAKESDFSPEELLCTSERQEVETQKTKAPVPKKRSSQRLRSDVYAPTGGYSITDYLKR